MLCLFYQFSNEAMLFGRIPQLSCLKCASKLLLKDVACQPLGDKRVVYRLLTCLRSLSAYGTCGLRRPFSSEANVLPTALNTSPVIVDFGASCCQGKLKENEDRFDKATLQHGLGYFAVFDGHRGSLSSDFLRQQLGIILSKTFVNEVDLAKTGHKLMQNAFDVCEEILEKEIQSSNLDQKTRGIQAKLSFSFSSNFPIEEISTLMQLVCVSTSSTG